MNTFSKKLLKKIIAFWVICAVIVSQSGINELALCTGEVFAAETANAVTYVDISGTVSDYVDTNPTVSSDKLQLNIMLNGRQVKNYYMSYDPDENIYSDQYFPESTANPTVTSAQLTSGVIVYVEYEAQDSPVWYINYPNGNNTTTTGKFARSATLPAQSASALNNYVKALTGINSMTYVFMGGISANDYKNLSPTSSFTRGNQRVDVYSQVISDDTNIALTKTNIYPTVSSYKTRSVVMTNKYNGIDYRGSGTGLMWARGNVNARELVATADITFRDIDIYIGTSAAYKWAVMENNGHTITFDSVNFKKESDGTTADYKIYNCNNLKNGLTVRYVDQRGNEISTASGTLVYNNANGLYFTVSNPAINSATKYTLNGVDVTAGVTNGTNIEMVDTFEAGSTTDTLDIVVETTQAVVIPVSFKNYEDGTVSYGTDNIEVLSDASNNKYIVLPETRVIDGSTRQVNEYYISNYDGQGTAKRVFPGDIIYLTEEQIASGIEAQVNLVPEGERIVYHNYGGKSDNSNTGLSPNSAVGSFSTVYEKAIELTQAGYKVSLVFMGGRSEAEINSINNNNVSSFTGTQDVSIPADTDNTTITGNNALYGITSQGSAKGYATAPDITYTATMNGINYGTSMILNDTCLALYNNVTFKDIGVYYLSKTTGTTQIDVTNTSENFFSYENIQTNINFTTQSGKIVKKNVIWRDADGVYPDVAKEESVLEDELGNLSLNIPSKVEGRQIKRAIIKDNAISFPNEGNKVIGASDDDGIVISVYYEDMPTYYVGNITYSSDNCDGLSPATAFDSFSELRNAINAADYSYEDEVRIVFVSSNVTTGIYQNLSGYASLEGGYTFAEEGLNKSVQTGSITDANAETGNTLFTPAAGKEMPIIHMTSSHNDIRYKSGFYLTKSDELQYNKITMDNLSIGGNELRWYCQGNDLEVGENMVDNIKHITPTSGYVINTNTGIYQDYPTASFIGGTWGSTNKQGHRDVQGNGSNSPTITVKSGTWGRIVGGARMGTMGTAENPFNATINVCGTADISLVTGSQTESYMHGSPTINVKDSANIIYLTAGTLGYANPVFGGHEYQNETYTSGYTQGSGTDIPRTVNVYGGNIKYLYGGSIARLTTSLADYGNTVINIIDDPENPGDGSGGKIENLFGGPAAGVIFGDITINVTDNDAEIGEMFGGGAGKSDYINYTMLKTAHSEGVINPGNVGFLPEGLEGTSSATSTLTDDQITPQGGHTTINMSAGKVTGNVFGGGDGYNYNDDGVEYYSVGQIWDGTEVNLSGTAHIVGNVYGGGDGFEQSDLIAQVYPQTKVTIKPQAVVVEGNVYGGGNNAYVKGSCIVDIDGGQIYGNIFGAGANSGISENTSVTVKNSQISGNIYGGGEYGEVPGNTEVQIQSSTVKEVYGAGLHGDVGGNTSVTMTDSTVNVVHGGGYDANVEGTTTIVLSGTTVEEKVAGGGEYGYTHGTSITIKDESVIKGSVVGGGVYGIVNGNTEVIIQNSTLESGVCAGGEYGNVTGSAVLRITDGNIAGDTIGGGINGDVGAGTTVEINGSSQLGNVYGGAEIGTVTGGTHIILNGSSTVGDIFGGGKGNVGDEITGNVIGNTTVTISGQSNVEGSVYGGGENGNVTGNTDVTIDDSHITKSVYGGGKSGKIHGSTEVSINNGSAIDQKVVGGGIEGTVDSGSTVNISASTVNEIYGGGLYGDILSGGTNVTVENGSEVNRVIGGGLTSGTSGGTHVTVSDSTINNQIIGAAEQGQVNGDVYVNIYETAENTNATNINGSVITGGMRGVVNGDSHLTINSDSGILTLNAEVCDGGYGPNAITHGSSHVNIQNVEMGIDSTTNEQYKFYLGGGSGSVEDNVYVDKDDSDLVFSFSTTNPRRQAEEFKGWYLTIGTEPAEVGEFMERLYGETRWGTAQIELDGTLSDVLNKKDTGETLKPEGQYVFTLDWDLRYYTIAYDANLDQGESYTPMSHTSAFVGQNRRIRFNTYTNGDLNFMGWNTEPDGSGLSFGDGSFAKLSETQLAEIASNYTAPTGNDDDKAYSVGTVTLYAMWSDIPTSVKAYGASAKVGQSAELTSELLDTLEGYTYTYQWYTYNNGIQEIVEGGTEKNLLVEDVTIDMDQKIYFVEVTMWDSQMNNAGVIFSNMATLTVEQLVISYYDALSVTAEDTTGLVHIDSAYAKFNETIKDDELFTAPEHDGFAFKGWYINSERTIPYDDENKEHAVMGNLDLYAGWREIGKMQLDDTDKVNQMAAQGTNLGNEFGFVGVQIRTFELNGFKQGLRFISCISRDFVKDMENLNTKNGKLKPTSSSQKGVGYGTVVTMKKKLAEDKLLVKDETASSVTKGNLVVPAVVTFEKCDNYEYYTAVVTGMPVRLYAEEAVARPYITYYDSNGNIQTYYYMETGNKAYGRGYCISYIETNDYVLNGGYYQDSDVESVEFLQQVHDDYQEYLNSK